MRTLDVTAVQARNAVAIVFTVNGFAFATWVSRIPEVRIALDLTPGQLGTVLLAISAASVLSLPTAGLWIQRFGAARVVGVGAAVASVGVGVAGIGAGFLEEVWLTALGLALFGLGSGTWDVAMNVEGAAVERALGRNIMPRFHAAFSIGTVLGAAVGAAAAATGVSVGTHLVIGALLVALMPAAATRKFLPAGTEHTEESAVRRSPWRAWVEPKTLAIGLMVLSMALTEGVANDWLAVALVDGYDVEPWVGSSGFALFVTAMTIGRVSGTALLDRFGRVPVLWSCTVVAGVGVLLVVFGELFVLVVLGILLWGLGASLGFPVGMSAAADEPVHAAARLSVVSTIGYTAFLAGPPVLGFLGDRVGVLHALLLVAVLLVPSALVVPSARPPRTVA